MKQFMNGIRQGFGDFGHTIATIVNTVLLFIVYIIGAGLTSIIAKIFGKRFMKTSLHKKSYWTDLNLKKEKMDNYYRQY